jgi:hypothetical protein
MWNGTIGAKWQCLVAAALFLSFLGSCSSSLATSVSLPNGTNIIGMSGLGSDAFSACGLDYFNSSYDRTCRYDDRGMFVFYDTAPDARWDCKSAYSSSYQMLPGIGYFIRITTPCDIQFLIPSVVDVTIFKGTNIMSVPVRTTLDNIEQYCGDKALIVGYFNSSQNTSCRYDRNGYFIRYDPSINGMGDCRSNYVSDDALEPFVGYFVRFLGKDGDGHSSCTLRYQDGQLVTPPVSMSSTTTSRSSTTTSRYSTSTVSVSPSSTTTVISSQRQLMLFSWDKSPFSSQIISLSDMMFSYEGSTSFIQNAKAAGKKVELYRNVEAIGDASSDYNSIPRSWALKNSTGGYVVEKGWTQNIHLDPANQQYRDYLSSVLLGNITKMGIYGVWADNGVVPVLALQARDSFSSTPINPKTGSPYTQDEWFNASIGLLNYVKGKTGLVITANGLWNGDAYFSYRNVYDRFFSESRVDGIFMEGIFGNTNGNLWVEYSWKNSIDLISTLQTKWLTSPSRHIVMYTRALTPKTVRFVYSSAMLAISTNGQNYLGLFFNETSQIQEAQRLFAIDLGLPTGNYSVVSGTHVYRRDFARGIVLVNAHDSSTYTITLGKNYRTSDGTILSSIQMGPKTGEVLIEVK